MSFTFVIFAWFCLSFLLFLWPGHLEYTYIDKATNLSMPGPSSANVCLMMFMYELNELNPSSSNRKWSATCSLPHPRGQSLLSRATLLPL
ncbi:hypothetical protein POJ06DRAFT_243586 [Lipomyces tetrasporus]|uniref:Secreted protein n=1 Tax=Lipomyces tetrasporus TaxID=54092 RepID=A0AAD7QZ36_9ASCO|nr:uncharacterized protein POJ06DRAFT_243586 [Lipomyces tetrasporus]KAJ8104104.1 hypothetical protein POJ06DRAFT_243586 [Lipomyces tetrasporus]